MGKNLSGKELPKGIRQRKDGRYEGRFTYQGESYTLYNRNLRDLVSEMQDKRYEVTHGIYAKKSKITVDSWFHIWLDDYKRQNVKFGTYKAYRAVYYDYIRNSLGRKRLQDIRGEHIQRLFNEMAGKYSRSTINLAKVVLNSMFEQACKNGIVMKNPVKNTTMPREKKCREIRVLTVEEQKLFLQYAQGSIYFPLYVVALGTGMRNGDADGKISLNQQKPSKHAGLRRFGPEKFLQRNNEFMKERPIFYKKPIKTEKDFSTWLRCFYYTTKAVITEYIYF